MALDFGYADKMVENSGIKVLAYGGSGNGKTLICATAPKPLVISAESGLLSLKKTNLERVYGIGTAGITYDIPVMRITSMQDLLDAYNWFTTNPQAKTIGTICIDSISEIAEVVLAAAKKVVKDPRQAYGEVIEKTLHIVRNFRDLPGFNVYVAAKMEPTKDEMTGLVRWGPSLPGAKLGNQLPYYFDEVFMLGIGQDQATKKSFRYLRTQPDMQYVAKDRSGALAEIEYPDLTRVFNKILGVSQA